MVTKTTVKKSTVVTPEQDVYLVSNQELVDCLMNYLHISEKGALLLEWNPNNTTLKVTHTKE